MARPHVLRRIARRLGGPLVVITLGACGTVDRGSPDTVEMGVATSFRTAAASIDALASEADLEVDTSVASTPTLVAQVSEGAGLDIVVLADESVAARLEVDGTIERVGPELTTPMVLAVPAGNRARVTGLDALSDPDLDVGLCDPRVPCGARAEEWLAGREVSLDTIEPSSASLVGRLSAGELDAAIVYRSEVVGSGGAIEEVPTVEAGTLSTTVLARVVGSDRSRATDRLVEILSSDDAVAAYIAAGYEIGD